jgi:hypothetical protein
METVVDFWHLAFADLIKQRAPLSFAVKSEVRLPIEMQRANLLLLQRFGSERQDEQARVLSWIWPRLSKVTIVEFKSPSGSSFRRGDLLRLCGYGPLYQAAHIEEVPLRGDLTQLLVIPSLVPTLLEEIAAMGWELCDLGGGYRRIDGAVYDLYVAVTDEVAEVERDGFLRIFSHLPVTDPKACWWLQQWMEERKNRPRRIQDMPGFDEMWEKFMVDLPFEQRIVGMSTEEVLSHFSPEQRLAGLSPEQRLLGLSPTEQLLAMPDEVLRGLTGAFLSSLPLETQEAIRRRFGRAEPMG